MATLKTLHASLYVDKQSYGYCAIISNQQQMGDFHKHNYYEVFLVISGTALHEANGASFPLEKGSLVFLRPDDEHRYLPSLSADFQFINFIMTKEVVDEISVLLGKGFASVVSFSEPYPLSRKLAGADYERILAGLENLMVYPRADIEGYNTCFKLTAIEILSCFYHRTVVYENMNFPAWLRSLMLEMHKEENYRRGLEAMFDISQYSPEHLCRVFQKYLRMSPTIFLNNIRMEEAALRLIYTNEEIIDVASTVGFDNLSYFYRRFKAWHGVSPGKYREMTQNVSVREVTF